MRKRKSLSGAREMPTPAKPARTSKVPKDEPRDVKLVRLATLRTKRILKSIEALGNLSRLKPTTAQTEKVFGAIKSVLESSYGKWTGEKPALPEFDMNAQEPTT